ncbi:MAG: ABC transporter substrate-binding protein [Hyphomicrobiales bacterium]|nr:ABC transporter substrate-binding protein [Hyphomicrobiales bacterium]
MPIIAILDSASPRGRGPELDAFYDGLGKAGVSGQHTTILYGWADNDYKRLVGLAQSFAGNEEVKVIVAAGGPVSAIAARNATSTKPIVFTTITNPAGSGLVKSLHAPDNVTGTWGYTTELDEKRLQALATIARPGAIGILANPNRPYPTNPDPAQQQSDLEAKAAAVGRSAIVCNVTDDREIENAFTASNGQVAGLVAAADPFFNSRREQVIALANRLGVPAIYQWRGFVESGGLMSYGPSKLEGYRNAGELAGQILNGADPKNLPVRETKVFELVVNGALAQQRGLVDPAAASFAAMVAALGNPKVTVI